MDPEIPIHNMHLMKSAKGTYRDPLMDGNYKDFQSSSQKTQIYEEEEVYPGNENRTYATLTNVKQEIKSPYQNRHSTPAAILLRPQNPYNASSVANGNPGASEKASTVPRLMQELEQSVLGNKIKIYDAGAAIAKAYDTREDGIPETILSFARKYWRQVTTPVMPQQLDIVSGSLFMNYGFGLLTQINTVSNSYRTSVYQQTTDVEEFQKMSGSRLYVSSNFSYPSEPPFTGAPIDMSLVPHSNQKAHIRLKKSLIQLLQVSCTNPQDIKNNAWSLPNDKFSKFSNALVFPPRLYDNLKQLHLEFFGLSYEELDTTWEDSYISLRCLSSYEGIASKKNVFKQLAAARQAYLTITFHEEFREAMAEIRYSEYDEASKEWKLRKRGTKKNVPSTSNVNQPEEEQATLRSSKRIRKQ